MAREKLNLALRFVANPLPMWVYDLETMLIIDANDAALALYGYRRSELIGKHVADLRASDGAETETLRACRPDAALPVSVSRHCRRKNGTALQIHVMTQPLVYEGRFAILAVAQDVKELQRS